MQEFYLSIEPKWIKRTVTYARFTRASSGFASLLNEPPSCAWIQVIIIIIWFWTGKWPRLNCSVWLGLALLGSCSYLLQTMQRTNGYNILFKFWFYLNIFKYFCYLFSKCVEHAYLSVLPTISPKKMKVDRCSWVLFLVCIATNIAKIKQVVHCAHDFELDPHFSMWLVWSS